jgi:hypothetical protein
MKANKTTRGWEVSNHRRRKDKESENNIDSATHTQILKQQQKKMARFTKYLSILTVNVNGLNTPNKRHHLANWIKKEDLTICCLQETHFIDRHKCWLRVKGWKKIYQANGPRE